jgi:hypothetical protein
MPIPTTMPLDSQAKRTFARNDWCGDCESSLQTGFQSRMPDVLFGVKARIGNRLRYATAKRMVKPAGGHRKTLQSRIQDVFTIQKARVEPISGQSRIPDALITPKVRVKPTGGPTGGHRKTLQPYMQNATFGLKAEAETRLRYATAERMRNPLVGRAG